MGGRHRTDEPEGGYNPYYQPPPPRRRASKGRVIVPLAGAVALALLAAVGAYVIVNRDQDCSDQKIALQVVTSPDIRPAIATIAERFSRSRAKVNDRCVSVTVKEADSASVTNGLAGTGPTDGKNIDADVWIPDSSLWVTKLKASATAKIPGNVSGSVAHSPVVLTAPKTAVPNLEKAFGGASWGGLMVAANVANPDGPGKKVRVLALDPTRNAAGLSALLAGAGVLRAAGSDNEQLVGVLRQLSESTVSTPSGLFASMSKRSTRVPVGVATEQAIWAYNAKNHPDTPFVALYPKEGTLVLDYPIVIATKDDQVGKAAKLFQDELGSPAAEKVLQQNGFRTPSGKGDAATLTAENGVSVKAVRTLKAPGAATVTQISQAWSRLKLGARILSLIDISGTMAAKSVGTDLTRMQLVAQTSIEGLKLFPDKSEIGTWVFSTHLNGRGVDYKETMPIGPLGGKVGDITRREALIRDLSNIKALPNGDTGLNDTLAEAYSKMKAEYEPDKVNTIIIFTDGIGNDDPDGGISNAEILQRLRQEYDRSQPVSIIIVALGADDAAGRKQMRAIAAATEGAAYFPRSPLEIRKVFLEGISRRLCAPNCDTGASTDSASKDGDTTQ
ncbi:substrate-binding and VWA domain-containing protein [Thermopolyspora sp. NPDC052614]|uniref:substrate-binding and VWA domain-containing protein n=1 Tax=Thermopolyspora sp. NPDC052614 TaxID=3155682 RepID=UPI0034226BFA